MECAYYFRILGGRHMECAYYFRILGGRAMECAYYFDFCRLCHNGVVSLVTAMLLYATQDEVCR